jgi:hypothetical protein
LNVGAAVGFPLERNWKMNSFPVLDLEVDHAFQAREWSLQRGGWCIWAGVLIAASAGLLGPGPLSKVTRSAANETLQIAYERFVHYRNPTKLRVQLANLDPPSDLRLEVEQKFLDRVEVTSITPQPVRQQLTATGVAYYFSKQQSAPHGDIVLHVNHERCGGARCLIKVNGTHTALVRQFVYP